MRPLNFIQPFLIAGAVLCHSPASAAPEDEVRAAGRKWVESIGMGDPDLMVSLYAEDAVLHGTTSPVVREGHALIREYFAGLTARVTMNFVEPQHIRIYDDITGRRR